MKALRYILIVLTLCLVLCACDNSVVHSTDTDEQKTATDFSEFLDNEGFVAGVSQGDFMQLMSKYTYDGTPIYDSQMTDGMFYDGLNGGGFTAYGEYFTYNNDYYESFDRSYVKYGNMLSTRVELGGLDFPYGITFSDTLEKVINKIGLENNPYDNFVADKDSATNMTLYVKDGESLIFQNLKMTDAAIDYEMPYVLEYSDVTDAYSDSEYTITVTRKVIMRFADNDNSMILSEFEMSVYEEKKLNVNLDIVSIEYKVVDYNGGIEDYKLVDFTECAAYQKHVNPENETEKEYTLLFNFEDYEKGSLIYDWYSLGLFDLEDKYIAEGQFADGGEWQLKIKYADGTEKISMGINKSPDKIFEKADIAFFDIMKYEFFERVPTSYKTPPTLDISVSYKIGNNSVINGISGVIAYRYKWKGLDYEADESFIPETISLNPNADCKVKVSLFDSEEIITEARLYTYTDDVNIRIETDCDYDKDNINLNLDIGKKYILVIEYYRGQAEYLINTVSEYEQ